MNSKLEIIKQIDNKLTDDISNFVRSLKSSYDKFSTEKVDPVIGVSMILSTIGIMEMTLNEFKMFILKGGSQ